MHLILQLTNGFQGPSLNVKLGISYCISLQRENCNACNIILFGFKNHSVRVSSCMYEYKKVLQKL